MGQIAEGICMSHLFIIHYSFQKRLFTNVPSLERWDKKGRLQVTVFLPQTPFVIKGKLRDPILSLI